MTKDLRVRGRFSECSIDTTALVGTVFSHDDSVPRQYHTSPQNLPAYVDAVHAAPGRYVQGYPSLIHLVARALLDAGRPVAPGRFHAVFTSSESLLAFQRESIEAAFGAPVRDRYGVSEFCVSMTECPERRLHVDMEFGIVEVEAEEETDDFVRGPLLVTGLSNDVTPFLRSFS